ncbi:MAG: hypothetical protein KF784_00120 [Fimbriimonadaceae bacterium]|nr:hypothetical protein [Fimbriimonadaceae bacterium]
MPELSGTKIALPGLNPADIAIGFSEVPNSIAITAICTASCARYQSLEDYLEVQTAKDQVLKLFTDTASLDHAMDLGYALGLIALQMTETKTAEIASVASEILSKGYTVSFPKQNRNKTWLSIKKLLKVLEQVEFDDALLCQFFDAATGVPIQIEINRRELQSERDYLFRFGMAMERAMFGKFESLVGLWLNDMNTDGHRTALCVWCNKGDFELVSAGMQALFENSLVGGGPLEKTRSEVLKYINDLRQPRVLLPNKRLLSEQRDKYLSDLQDVAQNSTSIEHLSAILERLRIQGQGASPADIQQLTIEFSESKNQ